MKLREVQIENFMGIESANFTVGDGGALFVGKSKSGKTSMANAVLACLKSKGFGACY
jgi:predicted ATP-dependent endonuclease of OLD family